MAQEMQVLPRRRRNTPEQFQRVLIARCQNPAQQFGQQHGVVGDHDVCDQAAAVIADCDVQIRSSGKGRVLNFV